MMATLRSFIADSRSGAGKPAVTRKPSAGHKGPLRLEYSEQPDRRNASNELGVPPPFRAGLSHLSGNRDAPLPREQRACTASVGRGWGWGRFLFFLCLLYPTPNPSPQPPRDASVAGTRLE